ncbi:putative hydro-lyase [soil metagenome]
MTTSEQFALTGAQARERYRNGVDSPTSGWAHGYTQANIIAVPKEWAYDVLLFAQRNPKPSPILAVSEPGATAVALAPEADIRTDVPRYRVWRNGNLADEPTDVRAEWRDDLVTFYVGCSFTFESALDDHGIPLRHVEQGTNVPMYITQRQCEPAGRLHGPLVVSMRPIPAAEVANAVTVSGRMPAVHGAPVHIGAPEELITSAIDKPDFGDPVQFHEGDVPVFWACGVTLQAAVIASGVPFAITHAPGYMFVTDIPDSRYVM